MPPRKYKNADGKPVPSVTGVIGKNLGWGSEGLNYWHWNQGREGFDFRESAQKAADVGTATHAAIEAELTGQPWTWDAYEADIRTPAQKAFEGWERWKKMVSFELIASERSLVSENYQYGGTADLAVVMDVPTLLDVKTSKATYEKDLCQVAAYAQLAEECTGQKVEQMGILRLGKLDGGIRPTILPADSEPMRKAWEVFVHLLFIHQAHRVLKEAL